MNAEGKPFFWWDCCAVAIEAPEIVEDGRGRGRRGLGCLLEELSLARIYIVDINMHVKSWNHVSPHWPCHIISHHTCIRYFRYFILVYYQEFHGPQCRESTNPSTHSMNVIGLICKISTPMVYSKSLNWSSWIRSSLSFTTVRMLTAAFFKRSTATCFEAWTCLDVIHNAMNAHVHDFCCRISFHYLQYVHNFCIVLFASFLYAFDFAFYIGCLQGPACTVTTVGLCSQAKILILLVDRWPSPSSNNTWRRCWVDRGRESTRMLHGVAWWPKCFLTCQVLSDYDPDMAAQEMIVEQFIAPWSKWCEMMWMCVFDA